MSKQPDEPWDERVEQGYLLRTAPLMQEIADYVKAKLPPGTDFGVLIVAPPVEGSKEGRVLALTTDRTRMAFYAAQWVLSLDNQGERA